ncbi:Mobile element protein [Candidatus Enterovibrio altilux]|uniref:Mobile element protein n=1 Tax=Candidatus Enterovibrio altilux TaxID=1927128 RepID=A0A291B8T4_9GAMM|nr:Mobile element protein [Candidatus Enterovibrio luxaltus]
MVTCVLLMPLIGLQGFINFVFKLIQLPLSCSHYLCIHKRTNMDNVTVKTKNKRSTEYLLIDFTG